MTEIIDRDSPRWNEFIHRLNARLPRYEKSCNFNFDHAKAVFEEMGNVDVFETLDSFKSAGGHCDCEIMLNVVIWNESGVAR